MTVFEAKYIAAGFALVFILFALEGYKQIVSKGMASLWHVSAAPLGNLIVILSFFALIAWLFLRTTEVQAPDFRLSWSAAINRLAQEGEKEFEFVTQLQNFYDDDLIQGYQTLDFTTSRPLHIKLLPRHANAPSHLPVKLLVAIRAGLVSNPIGSTLAIAWRIDDSYIFNRASDFSQIAFRTEGVDKDAERRLALEALESLPPEERYRFNPEALPEQQIPAFGSPTGGTQQSQYNKR